MKFRVEILSKVGLGKDLTRGLNSVIAILLGDVTLRGFSCNVMGSDPSSEVETKPWRVYSVANNLHK